MFRWRKELQALVQQLHQRITELERAVTSAGSSARPDLINALADMTVKQSEASSKLLTTVTEAAEKTAARALGRKSAATAQRGTDGRYLKKTAAAAKAPCKVCAGRTDITPADVDRHYAEGHPPVTVSVNGGPG